MSSGDENWFEGEVPAIAANACSVPPCWATKSRKNSIDSHIGVLTPPGVTTLTRMPILASAHSIAAIFEKCLTAALLAP